MGISFWRSHPNRARLPRRGLAVGTGAVALSAALMGGMASGAVGDPSGAVPVSIGPSVFSADEPTVVAVEDVTQIVPASGGQLLGFAPPASRDVADDRSGAQFRIAADLPSGPLGIPGIVLKAYKLAATRVAAETPQCKLPWFLLAGIGRIESGHAGNGNVNGYGDSLSRIRGPVLDGSLAGNAVITDSDGGKLDGDTGHDRAMGPMQFIPSTWARWGSDGNGDGKSNPDNIFDATYSAGRYLCSGVADIMAGGTKVQAVLRYNNSMAYVNNVLGWAAAYAAGVMPTNPIPEMTHAPADEGTGAAKKAAKEKAAKEKAAKEKAARERAARERDGGDRTKPSTPSTPPSSSKPKPKPPQNCLGPICLPPVPAPGR